MRQSPFSTKIRITQLFGKNPATYKLFGFDGHEGFDCTPNDPAKDSWNVYPMEAGKVILVDNDEHDNKSDAYGNYIIIDTGSRLWFYCHLKDVRVARYQTVSENDILGVMGNSGRSSGAHLHLGLKMRPIQNGNGYKGFVDPLKFIKQFIIKKNIQMRKGTYVEFLKKVWARETPSPEAKALAQLDIGWGAIVVNQAGDWTEIEAAGKKIGWVETIHIEACPNADLMKRAKESEKRIKELEKEISPLEKKIKSLETKHEKIEKELTDSKAKIKKLQDELKFRQKADEMMKKMLKKLNSSLDRLEAVSERLTTQMGE